MSPYYHINLNALCAHLALVWAHGTVSVITGRRYDKVIRISSHPSGDYTSIMYFIEKTTGTIYGTRSDIAPNLSLYYGTIDTFLLWDWENDLPVPTRDPSIRLKKTYGMYHHYMKI